MAIDRDAFERKTSDMAITRTLGFAGLLQLAHEFIKADVLTRPKNFFGYIELDGVGTWANDDGGAKWRKEVKALCPDSDFKASLLWLQGMDALTAADADRLAKVKEHRDALTHEMPLYLFSPGYDANPDVLTDALKVFFKLDRFWVQVEMDSGTFIDHPDATVDDVSTGPGMVLARAVEAFMSVHLPD